MNVMKNQFNIPQGTIIKGKWHKQTYKILRELGRGANGVVYLADWSGKPAALKLSDNNITVTAEVNVLKALKKAQGVTLGPSLLDVDDWETNNGIIPFYVMEYINGRDFITFISQRGRSWVGILILQLLADLDFLHKEGWIFGDLKPENLLISESPIKIRCIDVGGTTQQGRAIKEFTEFFDRGYWGLGSRKAEVSYDLFAVAMIMINAYYPLRFKKKASDTLKQLTEKIMNQPDLKKHSHVLIKALTGKYESAREMREDLITSIHQGNSRKSKQVERKPVSSHSTVTTRGRKTIRRKSRIGGVLETILILFIVSFLYAIYILELIL